MTLFKLESKNDLNELAIHTANVIESYLELTLSHKERARIALSGGSSPCQAYRLLGEKNLPWHRVDVFLGDERWVDSQDDASNAKMIRETLLLAKHGSNAKFYPMATTELPTPKESANEYGKLINTICQGTPPVFDLILLGLGEDGHTASLFPGDPALSVNNCTVTVSYGKGMERITLTASVLSAAEKVIFLVSGDNKSVALKRLMDSSEPSDRTPARLVQSKSEILILADYAASRK